MSTKVTHKNEVSVKVRCVSCKHKQTIKPGQIPPGGHPMCEKCFSPMVPVEARR